MGRTHENVFVPGPTGVGKSVVACALAQKACRGGYSALYTRAQSLTLADGILDRSVHNANRIEMKGDSMRKNSPKSPAPGVL
jgi:DNA replication protein DnaC